MTGGRRLLFVGDSITDSGRDRSDATSLGSGYVRLIAGRLGGGPTVLNKGLDGNRIYDLERRWTADVLDERPTTLTVKIGINDTWRRFDRGLPSPIDRFREAYARLLESAGRHLSAELIVITPFVLPVEPGQHEWLEDVGQRVEATVEVATAAGARVVRADLLMALAAQEHGAAVLAPDGVHPSARGYRILAEAWLATAGLVSAYAG